MVVADKEVQAEGDLAERYGWINRALPAEELGEFRHCCMISACQRPSPSFLPTAITPIVP
jgi:hypothetical protein